MKRRVSRLRSHSAAVSPGTRICGNSGSDLLRLALDYGTGSNNGNLLSQGITVPGLSVMRLS